MCGVPAKRLAAATVNGLEVVMRKAMVSVMGVAALIFALSSQAALVTLSSPVTVVNSGATFSIDILGVGFADAIDGGGFNLQFNPGVVKVLGIDFDPIWDFASAPPETPAGRLSDVYFNTTHMGGYKDDFRIATLRLKAIAQGDSAIGLTESSTFVFAGGLTEVTVSVAGGSVQVVPEPSTVAFAAIGLGIAWVAGRRRAIKSST